MTDLRCVPEGHRIKQRYQACTNPTALCFGAGGGGLLRPDSESRFDENAKYFGNLDVENLRFAISGRSGASF